MSFISRASVVAVLLAVAAALWPAAGASGTAGHKTVVIKDIDFTPSTVKVRKGQTVRWSWQDGPYTPHDVTFRKLRKHSPTQTSGSYSLRFAKRGTFKYECTIHLGMTGKVVVR